MANTTSTIRDRAKNRISELPSTLTDSTITEFAIDAIQEFSNYSGITIDSTNIDDQYMPGLTNWTVLYMLSFMTGAGVDFSYSLGELSVTKSAGSSTNQQQLTYYTTRVNSFLINFGRKFSTAVTTY